ncbi:AAA family ATPase [Aquincola tertiaricarbonis]|uniref:AAA family ATPase n=1 Tax=Aquincola tertiaricarbonis TaxID=391953 RepID=UPI000A52190D|nr:AAA family ATPase [Aquincola tertiaricarbonis]
MLNPVRFSHFELRPVERLLLAQGQPLSLGSRAFDVLCLLVERAGELVRKDELMDQVWPGLVVEDNNLQVQISALRRALGVKAIATIPGQGYRFALPVQPAPPAVDPAPMPLRQAPAGVAQRRSVTLVAGRFEGLHRLLRRDGPEALDELLGALQQALLAIADNRGGLLSRLDMQGFECLFGLPAAQEDDVLQAAEAALELAAEVQARGRQAAVPLGARIGIAHGSVVATPVAAPAGWRLAGTLPPLAHALAAAVPRHEVAVCEQTQQRLAPWFNLHPLVPDPLEAAEPHAPFATEPSPAEPATPAWRLGQRTGTDSRIDAAMLRGFTPLVGRADELDALRGWLDEARHGGGGHAVHIVADAGFGKSRLVHEFRSRIEPHEATVLAARCSPQGRLGAFLPFIQLLRSVLRLADVPPDALHDQAVQRLLAIDAGLEPWLPQLLHLLSIASPVHALPSTLEGHARRHALGQSLVAAITVAAQSAPLVLLFDDWHWADEASAEVMEQLVEVVASQRILLVVTARPQAVLGWSRHVHCSQLGLRPLQRGQTAAVVRSVCQASAVPEDITAVLHERSEGNPFFVEELCRALLQQGVLQRRADGTLAARGPLQAVSLPSTIEAVIQARLDALPPEVQAVARQAAVIGRDFTLGELQALVPDAAQVAPALSALVTAALVQPTRVVPEPGYRFRHALSQVVAYDSLLQRQRRDLHDRVGRLLEARQAGRLDEQLELLAYHFVNGHDREKAIVYSLRAGAKAARQATHAVAARHLQAAIDLMEQGADAIDDTTGRLLDAHVALGHSLTLLHGYAEPLLVHTCERARALSQQGGPMASRFAASWMLWRYYYNRALMAEAEAMADQLLAMARHSGERHRLLAAHTALGIVLHFRGRHAPARDALLAALQLQEPEAEAALAQAYGASPSVMAGSFLGQALNALGEAEAAEQACLSAQRQATEMAHPGSMAFATFYLSTFYLMHGDGPRAQLQAQVLEELARRHAFGHWLSLSQVNGAMVMLTDPAQAAAALARFRSAAEAVMAAGVNLLRIPYHLVLLRASLQAGRPDVAQAHWQAAHDALQHGGVHLFEPQLESARATLLLATGAEGAMEGFAQALALARGRQAQLLQLNIALEMAQALRQAGRLHDAPRLLGPVLDSLRQAPPTPLLQRVRQLVAAS